MDSQADITEAPLLRKGDRYVLFLNPFDKNPASETYWEPRYNAVGVWSGFVKIEDGKAQFSPTVAAELKQFDGVELTSFLGWVRAGAGEIIPGH